MTLVHEGDVVSGTITLTFPGDKPGDKPGVELMEKEFRLEQVRFRSSHLSFLVPVVPDRPDEWLLFNLQLAGGGLRGTFKVNDPKREDSLPVEFQKD